MGMGVRVLAAMAALALPSAVAAAVQDFAGTWQTTTTYSDPRCANALDNTTQLEVSAITEDSLTVSSPGSSESAILTRDPASGAYVWGTDAGDYSNFMRARLVRQQGELRFEMMTREGVFNCTATVVGTRAVAVTGPGDQAQSGDGTAPSGDDDDMYVYLLLGMVLLVGLAGLTLKMQQRAKAEAAASAAKQDKLANNAKMQENRATCAKLANELSEANQELKAAQDTGQDGLRDFEKARLAFWQGIREQLRGDAQFHVEDLIRIQGIGPPDSQSLRRDPAGYPEEVMEECRANLRRIQEAKDAIPRLSDNVEKLKASRVSLGCEALERAAGAPDGYISSM